jgi:hypothetical protein
MATAAPVVNDEEGGSGEGDYVEEPDLPDEDEDEEYDGSVSYIDHYAGSVEVHLRYDGSRG